MVILLVCLAIVTFCAPDMSAYTDMHRCILATDSSPIVTIPACRPPTPCEIGHTIYIPRSPHCNNSYWVTRSDPYRIRPYIPHAEELLCSPNRCSRTCEEPIIYTGLDFGFSYQHSFSAADLAQCIFAATEWDIYGSAVPNRPQNALLADQFGLSPEYVGQISFAPTIKNSSLHAQGCWNMYTTHGGHQFFIRGLATLTHQTRTLYDNDCATPTPCDTEAIGGPYPPGAMAQEAVPAAPTLAAALDGTWITGDQRTAWCGARLTTCALSATNLAGLTIDAGYATPEYDQYRSAMFIRYRAPTGTHITETMRHRRSLFAPIIGDGAHHEIGAGFTIQREFWRTNNDHTLQFRCDGYSTHLCANQQVRTFDLKTQGAFSRYLLLKTIDPSTQAYSGEIVPASCFTTRTVTSSVQASGEVSLQFIWHTPHTSLSIGYEFFGRSRETLRICTPQSTGNYGIKGCTGVYGYTYTVDQTTGTINGESSPFAVPLNSTASSSTITRCGEVDPNGGTSSYTGSSVIISWNNPWSTSATTASTVPLGTIVPYDVAVAFLSAPPTILTDSTVNIQSGVAPKQIVHKGFFTLQHIWSSWRHEPYLVLGFSAEGSGEVCSLKQWTAWIQGGVSW